MLRTVIIATTLLLATWAAERRADAQPEFTSDRVSHGSIATGNVPLDRIRKHGMMVFSVPFTKNVGYGDGPMNPLDTTSPGGRPTLQGNGSFLRVNGLDAQSCLECHSVASNLVVPSRFTVGGVGGSSANAMARPTKIDVSDAGGNGLADYDGRFINPPFLFGSGGVELAAKEMTADLQALKAIATSRPNQDVDLVTKGVSFGKIRFQNGQLDLSRIEGIDDDLVVRPFGRKGEFATTRAFDVGAMMFHFGMQPIEAPGVGVGNDADNDGVVDELSPGDLSALEIFNTTLDRPHEDPRTAASEAGRVTFNAIGCADCHRPTLHTRSPILTYTFPQVETDPAQNVFYSTDLRNSRPGFTQSPVGGVVVRLFSDLKRHDMGPELAESNGSPLASWFVTARLWGVADTAPYLHDGRAHTLSEAILLHGGEAKPVRDTFANLSPLAQDQLLAFLGTLRTPENPAGDLLGR